MSIIIKGITKAQFYKDTNKIPYIDVGWDIEELPPHGRLIDADALLDELQKLFDEREKDARFSGNKGVFIGWNDAIYKIKTAPTIIEAEEAKE